VHDVAELLIVQVTLADDPFTRSVQVTDWPEPGAVAATQPKFLKVPLMATYLLTVDSSPRQWRWHGLRGCLWRWPRPGPSGCPAWRTVIGHLIRDKTGTIVRRPYKGLA